MKATKNKKILVTGGAGFIGSHIVDLCIDNGYQVVVLDNLSTGKKNNINPQAHFIPMDINDERLHQVFKAENPEYVCHQAAQISVSYSVKHPDIDAHQNITGILNVLKACHENKVKGVVFASSGGTVYGEPNNLPINENYAFAPGSPYGISKMSSEYYLDFYLRQYKMDYVTLRYANVYGPRQDPFGEAGVIAIFTQKMLNGEIPTINGDGEYIRDYVYVEDVARACLLGIKNMLKLSGLNSDLSNRKSQFNAFNIGTGLGFSVNQLYQYLKEILAFPNKAQYGPARPGDLRKSILDCQNAEKYLQWEPTVTFKEGLKKTVDWFAEKNKG